MNLGYLGLVRLSGVRLCWVGWGQVGLGWLGQVRLGWVMLGSDMYFIMTDNRIEYLNSLVKFK